MTHHPPALPVAPGLQRRKDSAVTRPIRKAFARAFWFCRVLCDSLTLQDVLCSGVDADQITRNMHQA